MTFVHTKGTICERVSMIILSYFVSLFAGEDLQVLIRACE